jgi:hypothetical protein
MDVLLLGAAAILLLVLTIWIVWRPGGGDAASGPEEATRMMPQGDEFEDQYTSATADLSAAGVAVGNASEAALEDAARATAAAPGPVVPVAQTVTTPPWPADTIHTEGSATGLEPIRRTPADAVSSFTAVTPLRIGLGAAALLTFAAAIAGAWLYARVQRERNKPLNRLRRRFR